LLSSLSGAAITRAKIQGVSHEFSTIPDVKEDVISILLNLKQVRLLMHSEEPQVIKLNVKGIKKIRAGDFDVPSQVEIMNPDLLVATLTSKDAKLEIEAMVEKGMGYTPKEVLEHDKVEVGTLTLDAIFTPIRKVNYEVENMRVGDRTDYNRLRISIETDGTIEPREALEKSINILMRQLEALVFSESKKIAEVPIKEEMPSQAESVEKEGIQEEGADDPLKVRIDDLGLSRRTFNALEGAGIRTVGGLVKKSRQDLLELSGIGEKAVSEIENALRGLNIELKR
jgi:DNA-directed RNA polymerase subunit alpha